MKTVQDKPLPTQRLVRDSSRPPLPKSGKAGSQLPRPKPEPIEAALAEQLHLSFQGCSTDGLCVERRVLLDKEIGGYRIILIRERQAHAADLSLSPREQQIARMIAQGYPNKAIAAELDISCWTVGTHLRRVFAKLGVACRAAMVARLIEMGYERLIK